MSLMQHYDKVITRMQQDICRLIEEKAEIEACVEMLIEIRDQARAVHATGAGTYNDKRTSVDRKKLSDLGLMVKESYKTVPSEFNGSEGDGDGPGSIVGAGQAVSRRGHPVR
jgi:hypothetical protein